MPTQTILHIRQTAAGKGKHAIRLTLRRPGQPDLEAEVTIRFSLTDQEQEDLRWYMEDYLQRAEAAEPVTAEQVEAMMRARGEELYRLVLAANLDTQAIWFAVREGLADLRVEITTGVAEAAAIPWELLRDPQSDSAISLRVKAFVRVQSNPNLSFVPAPPAAEGRLRLLYVVCRPGGAADVSLRAVANRLLQDLGGDLARFEITALRPPTFERLQTVLTDAKAAGRPFHIVHFDGHGVYEDLSSTVLADWLKAINALTLGGPRTGKHGYLLFEHPSSDQKMRPVSGEELGKLLHDTGVPVLALNACQSAMHEATQKPAGTANVHDEVRAIGSLAQAVVDQGIPAVLGMRYSVYVVTAAQYIGQLYAALAKGRPFGEAASEGRKHLAANPDRWVGLEPRPLQDWFVPVVYEAMPIELLPPKSPQGDLASVAATLVAGRGELDPIQTSDILRRYVPDTDFIGRDETLLLLDRAFDGHPVVLLHAYAGQGKTATAVEFARWYAMTGGLGPQPEVMLTSFESHTDLTDVLNKIGQKFGPLLQANGIEWHSLNRPGERRQWVMRLLRQFPVLWIWDNVEPVAGFPAGAESQWTADEQAELADFLKQISLDRATQARLLLTSRRDEAAWLGRIPYRVAMPRMSREDAARLALKLGEERGLAREEVTGWGPLLDYCAGNPLTLRVIAGQAVRMGLRRAGQIAAFIQAVREGEQPIQDADAREGRDRSLAASLDYGFRSAFRADELPIIALLHLFQGTVDVDALALMGNEGDDYALPELAGKTKAQLVSLLDRAAEVGLLTRLTPDAWAADAWTIHPALPWYLRQLFEQYYPHVPGTSESAWHVPPPPPSTAESALRAWVEALGGLGDYYTGQYINGNRGVIQPLALEEANLLHARRAARRHGWWGPVIATMQGLRILLYEQYQGRTAEWARLVAEIAPDYCAPDDGPIPGREADYSLVMSYRVDLARQVERDLPAADRLQGKVVAWDRQQAAPALALPPTAPLDAGQRNRIRTLGVSVEILGHILRDQNDGNCVVRFEEAIACHRRTGDTATEAITHYNLGRAYHEVPAIRDLDAAEAAYRRELALLNPNDASGRASTIKQIGMVHHERFRETRQRGAPAETVLRHAQAAETHYRQALALCPPSAVADLGPIHNNLGELYRQVGQIEPAREHYERAAQYSEQSGNRYHAGSTRYNLAIMYREAAGREPARRRDLLRRAAAYAAASLRDFQHYQGRAADMEALARRLMEGIEGELRE